MNLVVFYINENQLTTLTLPPGLSGLTALSLDGNPLRSLILPQPLAEGALRIYFDKHWTTAAALRAQGVSVFTYPLTLSLVEAKRTATGAFDCMLTGPPGNYLIQFSPDLSTWTDFLAVVNETGSVKVTDPAARTRPRGFYRAHESNVQPVADMAYIPPGTFTMGSPESEAERFSDETQHQVTLTRGFWMGRYEVTQGEYLEVIGNNPSYFRNGTPPWSIGTGGEVTNELRHPVVHLTWFDATNYCAKLTTGERAAGHIPSNWRYRLPTEAEWEFACRGETTTAFHYGPALRDSMANFLAGYEYDSTAGTIMTGRTYLGRTSDVGSYAPNSFGLYDMHGNVQEWCQDWFGDYPNRSVSDPVGPKTGSFRVFRGGSSAHDGRGCRSAQRISGYPTTSFFTIGLRVVLATGQ